MSCLQEVKDLFQRADCNRDGKLSFDELRPVLLAIGTPAADIPVIFSSIDKDSDGSVELSEFVAWAWGESAGRQEALIGAKAASELAITRIGNTLRNKGVRPEALFASIDLDRNGFLSRDEFFRIVRTNDPSITKSLLEAAFNTVDGNGNGWISPDEFAAAINKDWAKQTAEVELGTAEVLVEVPPNTWPGQLVAIQHAGNTYNVIVPPNKYPGTIFKVTLQLAAPPQQAIYTTATATELLVQVPHGVTPGSLLGFDHAGTHYNVPVPPGSLPGTSFKVSLQ